MADVLTIPTESTAGKKIDPVRNMERLWLEVGTTSANGCSIENHRVPGANLRKLRDDEPRDPWQTHATEPVPVVIEVYADRLDAVLARTRTRMHEATYQTARDIALGRVKNWERENKARLDSITSPEERAKHVRIHCNFRPEHEYAALQLHGGMPPLAFCRVVNPKDRNKKADAFDFLEPVDDDSPGLTDEAFFKKYKARKADFMVEAPPTPFNAAQRANENLAQQLAAALKSIADSK